MGALLLESVLELGAAVDFFTIDSDDSIADALRDRKDLEVIRSSTKWQWERWYSRKPFFAFLSGTLARARAHRRLCDKLIERNRRQPYDCILQISQTELFKLGRHRDELPPIVVYPCTHAAGELRWHRRESAYAIQSEGAIMHYIMRLFLLYRAGVQRRELQKPAMVIGMSRRFNELLSQDYGVDPRRQRVSYHPIRMPNSGNGTIGRENVWHQGRPVRVLYVARISVRKGVDQVIELSHRLDDLHGQLQIDVIGDRSDWSNYLDHLKELNPRNSRYLGPLKSADLMSLYEQSDILVLPSMYEPGGLVVGEALSRGVCTVVSDEVGSGELVSAEACRKFPAGDVDAFERSVRQMFEDIKTKPQRLRQAARDQAWQHFAPDKIAAQLLDLLQTATDQRRQAVRQT